MQEKAAHDTPNIHLEHQPLCYTHRKHRLNYVKTELLLVVGLNFDTLNP